MANYYLSKCPTYFTGGSGCVTVGSTRFSYFDVLNLKIHHTHIKYDFVTDKDLFILGPDSGGC